jgi:hypothetical protein
MGLLLALIGSVPVAHAQDSQEPTSAGAPVALSEVTVRERRDRGYQAVGAASATKVETPVVETPVSIRLDQRYFESSNITDPLVRIPRLGIIPGAPLTVLGSIQVAY